MKSNRRTKKGAIIALSLAGALAITGAFAFLSDSDSAVNRFSFTDEDGNTTVDVDVIEPDWDPKMGEDILPLDTVAKNPQVVNSGENDVYAFVTVLVPTAKSIKLNNADGTSYEAEDVELFAYKVNDGWIEVTDTATGSANLEKRTIQISDFTLPDGDSGARNIKIATDKSITNEGDSNVYFTAHTYAYAKKDATTNKKEMTKIKADSTSGSVFDSVTMINIADSRTAMSLEEVYDYWDNLVEDETTASAAEYVKSVSQDTDAKTVTVTSNLGNTITYTELADGTVADEDGNVQYKTSSQLKADDNINIYVTTNAIQAANLNTKDVDEVWDICTNASTDVDEADAADAEFDYFAIIASDTGAKSAVKG